MELIIDHREHDLINTLKIHFTSKTLDLADIIIQHNDSIICAIERKTYNDLSNSIKDGRYHEQKKRLIDNFISHNIPVLYIIEGTHTPKCLPIYNLTSSLINTILRDKIPIFQTTHIQHTSDFITQLFHKYQKGDINFVPTTYIDNLKLRKKDNKNEQDSMLFILCQIPRISPKTATIIRQTYPSIKHLILTYEHTEYPELLLKDIILDNGKRLGLTASKRIWTYLCT